MRTDLYGLNPDELAVVLRVVEGLADAQIATGMDVSQRTVAYHVSQAKRKMGCRTRTQLAVRWVREQEHGWEQAA